MSFNLSDLRDITRDEIKVDPDGDIWGNTVLDRYNLTAHRKIQKDLDYGFPGNENGSTTIVSDGSLEYAVPTDLGRIQLVKNGNFVLDSTTKIELLQFQQLDEAGTPSQYYKTASVIGFDKLPNGITFDLFYLKFATTPTETTNSGLPDRDEVKHAIALWAKYLAWKSPKGNDDTAEMAKAEYEDFLTEIRFEQWTQQEHQFGLSIGGTFGRSRGRHHHGHHNSLC